MNIPAPDAINPPPTPAKRQQKASFDPVLDERVNPEIQVR